MLIGGAGAIFAILALRLFWRQSAARGVFDWPLYRSRAGNAGYNVDVVGESFHGDAITRAVGGIQPEGIETHLDAYLVYDDINAYDDQAIRIEINGDTVGYLSRDHAKRYRDNMRKAGLDHRTVRCRARVYSLGNGLFSVKLGMSGYLKPPTICNKEETFER